MATAIMQKLLQRIYWLLWCTQLSFIWLMRYCYVQSEYYSSMWSPLVTRKSNISS